MEVTSLGVVLINYKHSHSAASFTRMQTPNSLRHVIVRDIFTPSHPWWKQYIARQPLTLLPPTGINAAMVPAVNWGDNCLLIPRLQEVKLTERAMMGSMVIIKLTFERLTKISSVRTNYIVSHFKKEPNKLNVLL